MSQNKITITLLDKLKQLWGYSYDKDIAQRLRLTSQEYCNLKSKTLTKLNKSLIEELLKRDGAAS